MPDACGGQEKVSDPPGLELQTVESGHVGAGNIAGSSARTTRALNLEPLLQLHYFL